MWVVLVDSWVLAWLDVSAWVYPLMSLLTAPSVFCSSSFQKRAVKSDNLGGLVFLVFLLRRGAMVVCLDC